jgi:hypothetical protein
MNARDFLQKHPTFYEDVLRKVFGSEAPTDANPIPSFGGNVLFHRYHHLNDQAIGVFKRLLILVAMTHSHLDAAPVIPDILAFLLGFLPEDECFVTIQLMIFNAKKQMGTIMSLGKIEVSLLLYAFEQLLKEFLPDLFNRKFLFLSFFNRFILLFTNI